MAAKGSSSDPNRNRVRWREHWMMHQVFHGIEVDAHDQENFLFAYLRDFFEGDLEATGIFVRTFSPEAPGTHVNVRLHAGSSEPLLELVGEVIWINPYRPGDSNNLSPGMGIRFLDLTGEECHLLIALMRRIAYLADEGPDASAGEPALP